MSLVVSLVGALILGIGGAVFVAPGVLTRALRGLLEHRLLPWISVLRIVLGILFVLAAPDTRAPILVTAVGVLAIAAGILLPVAGIERLRRWVDWWVARPRSVIRVWAVLAMVLGAALVRAAW